MVWGETLSQPKSAEAKQKADKSDAILCHVSDLISFSLERKEPKQEEKRAKKSAAKVK
jgi:hypothetical protein